MKYSELSLPSSIAMGGSFKPSMKPKRYIRLALLLPLGKMNSEGRPSLAGAHLL